MRNVQGSKRRPRLAGTICRHPYSERQRGRLEDDCRQSEQISTPTRRPHRIGSRTRIDVAGELMPSHRLRTYGSLRSPPSVFDLSTPLYGEDKRKAARTIGERLSTPLYGEDSENGGRLRYTEKTARTMVDSVVRGRQRGKSETDSRRDRSCEQI